MLTSLYTERELQRLWERQQFRREALLTEDGVRVEVLFPGFPTGEGGPDFREARLLFGGAPLQGDVELHLTPSGWHAHGHDRDGAYAGVVLHVVLRRDPFTEPPRGMPLLVLEPYLHGAPAPPVRAGEEDLERLGEEWFAQRRARLLRARERGSADGALYREILVGLGYKHNQAAMAELARRCPLAALEGEAGRIEARLRAGAEAVPRAMWRLRNVRPANHPWRRLSGLARFLAEAREEGLERGLARRRTTAEMAAWLDPDGAGLIGASRAREIALNVFVPWLGPEAWRAAAGEKPPSLPRKLRLGFGARVTTVRAYFGALRAMRVSDFSLAPPPGGC